MTFAFPFALFGLPLPWLIWRFVPAHRERVVSLRFPFFRKIVDTVEARAEAGAVIRQRTYYQMTAATIIWALLIVAIARPERLGAPVEITKSARDVVLAVDISGSMDTVDFVGANGDRLQRLAAVKRVVGDFVAARDGDRLGLIVFGTQAFLQSPLTDDVRTIIELVDQVEVGMAGPQTAIGDAIGLSIRTFEASEVEQRLLILLSDGADTGSRMGPVNAAEIAKTKGVEIHTIAVGDPAGRGENRVDTAALADIARRTGGSTFFASDLEALEDVYTRIDAMTPRLVEQLSYRPRTSQAPLALGIAAVLGIGALTFLTLRRRGKRSA